MSTERDPGRGRRAALGACLALAAAPAWAQEEAIAESPWSAIDRLLGLFGLSCGQLLGFFAALLVLHCACLYFGTRLAGLRASFGRAVLALLLTAAIAVPVAFVLFLAILILRLGPGAQEAAGHLVLAGAQTLAIVLLYRTGFGRALFGYLATLLLSTAGQAVLLVLLF